MSLKPNKRMKTIEQRAEEYVPNTITAHIFKSSPLKGLIVRILRDAYIAGAKEQKAIEEEVTLKKYDAMTGKQLDREENFTSWYFQNAKGAPTFSDAIEWARKQTIDEVCEWMTNFKNGNGEFPLYDFVGNLRKSMEE